MLERIKKEPALIAGLVQAAILLVTAFGLNLSSEQVAAINTATAAVLALVVRKSVSPVTGRR